MLIKLLLLLARLHHKVELMLFSWMLSLMFPRDLIKCRLLEECRAETPTGNPCPPKETSTLKLKHYHFLQYVYQNTVGFVATFT